MKYKTCPECHGVGEHFVYSVDVGGPQPEEYPPCDTCPGTGQVVDVEATLEDQEKRLRVVEAWQAASQREFKRLANPRTLRMEDSNDY